MFMIRRCDALKVSRARMAALSTFMALVNRHSILRVALAGLIVSGCGVREDQADQLSSSSGQLVGASVNVSSNTHTIQPASCDVDDMKTWVRANMLDYYLFNDQVDTNLDITALDTPEAVTVNLRVQPQDRFSYMTDESSYDAFFNEGQAFGYGWTLTQAANDAWFFSLIQPGSPLELAGAARGDELLSINGIPLSSTFEPGTASFSDEVFPVDNTATVDIAVRKPAGGVQTLTVQRSTYTLQTVLDSSVLTVNTLNVGYLAFYQFLQTSTAELDAAFAQFDNANIDELVIDLRFNSGGRVNVANDLASYIIGGNRNNEIFARFAYNQTHRINDFAINYEAKTGAPQVNRVFVLQSADTCSASELVVNSLRAHMEVITVGDTSCGKPYATIPNTACSKVLNALEIDIQNADGTGGYFQGIAADCPVAENVAFALGSMSEPLLAKALEFINTGACGATAFSSDRLLNDATTPSHTPLKPQWQGGNLM